MEYVLHSTQPEHHHAVRAEHPSPARTRTKDSLALARHPFLKGTTAPVSDRPSAPGGGRNTRHPTGIRVVITLLALLALVLGPLGYLRGLQAHTHAGSAAEWFTLAFGAAVGIPLLAAAVATVAADRKAALWSLALLLWPLVYVTAIHLTQAL